MLKRFLMALVALVLAGPVMAQSGPLRLTITDGVIEPLPFAVPGFQAENTEAAQVASDITRLVAADLSGTGLFREIPASVFISAHSSFTQTVAYADWRAINAQALITGAVTVAGNQLVVKFRLYDVFSGSEMGGGLQFAGTVDGWRRMAHKVADAAYSRITGEGGYFDSRVVFVSETGSKNERQKRLAIMDYDGANVQFLTDSTALVLAPRFSPTGDRVLYTSFVSGFPRINLLDVATVGTRQLQTADGEMAFSPRFSRDGSQVIYSVSNGGNTDIYRGDIASGASTRLTSAPDARRISFGDGRYGTPVWSPRGDLVAFTKQNAGRFHIGVMRTDGSEERLLTASFLDESPTWSPNGRVIMFMRETQGAGGTSSLYSVDISGRNLKPVTLPNGASDPSWGPLQP